MRILVVDDQKTTGMALCHMLASLGHAPRLVGCGVEAWDILSREDWRLILTDWVMPRMDGLELCRRIRGIAGGAYRYVIMLTVRADRSDRLEGLGAGADDFLTRPVDEDELFVRLAIARRILAMQSDLEAKNARLAEMAGTDPLTGLGNRRRLDAMTAGSRTASGRASAYSVVSLDIDHFKSYNDRHGHPAGDEVLRTVARLLRGGTRSDDLVARTGGEEFVIVMPETGSVEALAIAERLRRTIAEAPWPCGPVTASLGVATVRGPLSSEVYSTALEAADRALYRSKREGRNRVTLASISGGGEVRAIPFVAGRDSLAV